MSHFFFRKFAGREREVSVGRGVGIEWRGGERGKNQQFEFLPHVSVHSRSVVCFLNRIVDV